MSHRRTRLLLLLPAAVITTIALTGCSQVAGFVHKTHEESFADRAAATQGWVGVATPTWLPADATDIKNLATDDETNAVVRVTSSAKLPALCTEADRVGIPFETPAWAPTFERFPDRVQRCGAYEVVREKDGWFGWFTATETGQTPADTVRTPTTSP